MINEVKTVTNLTAANDKIKTLEKQNKEYKQMLVYCKKQMDMMDRKIKRYEKSLLSAVTTLDWKEI